MTTQRALQRISWRFSQGKTFKPNQNDAEAFNVIYKYYQDQQKQTFKSNKMFAKLYIWLLALELKTNKSTIFETIARQNIIEKLSKPLSYFVESFRKYLNLQEWVEVHEKYQINTNKHPYLIAESERKKNRKALERMLEQEELKTIAGNAWHYKDVEDNLMAEVNHAIRELWGCD